MIKSYVTFTEFMGVEIVPVSEAVVTAYVTLFQNGRSAEKYVTAIAWICDFLGYPVDDSKLMTVRGSREWIPAWRTRSLKQLLNGLKRSSPAVKKAVGISWETTQGLYRLASARGKHDFAAAVVLASTCLLRVKNELFPLEFDDVQRHSRVRVLREGETTYLQIDFKSRKNRPEGATVKRNCTCHVNPDLCSPHAVVRLLRRTGRKPSGRIFNLNYTSFTRDMRHFLGVLQVEGAETATSHGFRRGSAKEILSRGGRLADILAAGDWRSPAFLEYLDKESVEEAAVLEAVLQKDEGAPGSSAQVLPPYGIQQSNKRPRLEHGQAQEVAAPGRAPMPSHEEFLKALDADLPEFLRFMNS